MSELTLTLIKMGFLALLWIFALAIASAIRADLFGVRPRQSRGATPAPKPAAAGAPAAAAAAAAKPAKPAKLNRGAPTLAVVIEGASTQSATAIGTTDRSVRTEGGRIGTDASLANVTNVLRKSDKISATHVTPRPDR